MHCSTKNLTRRSVQLAVRNSWLSSLLAKLTQAIVHGSLLLAIAPPRFPGGGLVFSASHAGGYSYWRWWI